MKYCRKIIVLEAPDDVLMKRLEDGDNFNDAVETIPKRIKTYRCNKDQGCSNINSTIYISTVHSYFSFIKSKLPFQRDNVSSH